MRALIFPLITIILLSCDNEPSRSYLEGNYQVRRYRANGYIGNDFFDALIADDTLKLAREFLEYRSSNAMIPSKCFGDTLVSGKTIISIPLKKKYDHLIFSDFMVHTPQDSCFSKSTIDTIKFEEREQVLVEFKACPYYLEDCEPKSGELFQVFQH